jgi:hypothetical protein
MSQTLSALLGSLLRSGARRVRVEDLARQHLSLSHAAEHDRRSPRSGACPDAELAEHIRQHIAASRLHGEGNRKLWARLRFAGVRTSPRRVRRVKRENLAPHRVGRTETRPHVGRSSPTRSMKCGEQTAPRDRGLRLWVQTTRRQWHELATASAERVTADSPVKFRGNPAWPNELHWKPQFVNLVEIISTALAWRGSSREELDMRCRGTFAEV